VRDGRLLTPTLASGCLAGITRELVLEWCDEAIEEDAPVEVLRDAEEVFVVSTVRDVQPVHACEGRLYPAPGPVTSRVKERWAEGVARTLDP
jgi:branched-chain amino acid aminotransferase